MFLDPHTPALILAPMEGVTDAPLREFLTRSGLYDWCVSEFIRVSIQSLPSKVFLKHVPELKRSSRTSSGIPVQVQILGGDPVRLAESAVAAIEAGALGIDLNFGCPAPTVNRHDGGATLLKFPHRIESIVRAVRDAVPARFPVSAKMRLGFDDPSVIDENAKRAEQGGASWITIHGRTKVQGYTPPAYWEPIGRVRRSLSIPVVANGEIWSMEDFRRCREQSGALHFMIGRGALAAPWLAAGIRKELGLPRMATPHPLEFPKEPAPEAEPGNSHAEARAAWGEFFQDYARVQPSENRLKQWARYLHSRKNITWWDEIKGMRTTPEILRHLTGDPAQSLPL